MKKLVIDVEENLFAILQPYTDAERSQYIQALIVRDLNEGIEQKLYEDVQRIKAEMIGRLQEAEEKAGEKK